MIKKFDPMNFLSLSSIKYMRGALSNGLVRWTAQIPLISDKIIFPPGWWARFRKWGVFATFSTNVVWRTAHIFQTYISLPSQKILVVYVYPSLYVLTLNIIMIMRKSWPKPKKIVSYVFLLIIIVRFRVWCNICERPFSIILFGKKHTASPI